MLTLDDDLCRLQELTPLILQKLDLVGVRRCLSASTPFLPLAPKPNIDGLPMSSTPGPLSRTESREQRPLPAPLANSSTPLKMEPLPQSWIWQRQESERLERLEALKKRRRSEPFGLRVRPMTTDGRPVSALVREFQGSWNRLRIATPSTDSRSTRPRVRTPSVPSQELTMPRELVHDGRRVWTAPAEGVAERRRLPRLTLKRGASRSAFPRPPPLAEASVLHPFAVNHTESTTSVV